MFNDFDSGSFKAARPPLSNTAEVVRTGSAFPTSIKFPNVTFPKMAAMRPTHDRSPKPVVLKPKKNKMAVVHINPVVGWRWTNRRLVGYCSLETTSRQLKPQLMRQLKTALRHTTDSSVLIAQMKKTLTAEAIRLNAAKIFTLTKQV